MPRTSFVTVAILVGLLFVAPAQSVTIKITPEGHEATLSPDQAAALFQDLLALHVDPNVALAIIKQAAVVNGKDNGGRLVVTVTEDDPGEILSCYGVVVIGDGVAGAIIDSQLGDGSFEGSPQHQTNGSYGTALIFEGTPSVNVPLKLHIDIVFGR